MVKHTQTNRRLLPTNCLSVFGHLVGLALKVLIFTYNIYNSRLNNNLNFQSLKCVISGTKCIEEAISHDDINKTRKISNKWILIEKLF